MLSARKLDLFSSDEVALIGRARGFALSVGSLAVLCATSYTQTEREEYAEELETLRKAYRSSLDTVLTQELSQRLGPELEGPLEVVWAFRDKIDGLDQSDHFGTLTRSSAATIAKRAKNDVLPAIYKIIMLIQDKEFKQQTAQAEIIQEKAAALDSMLTEMDQIGQTVRLISLNASVEAARAGGESGRAFKVIADEIRSLADRSSGLISRTKTYVEKEDLTLLITDRAIISS
jgi:hypothetical protein